MSIKVGEKVSGKISGITNFGAFVDLGEGKTGLVHISEVSNSYVKDIKDVLKVGEEVEVKVMTVGDDGKVSLSIKRASEDADKPAPKKEYKKKFNNNNRENSYSNQRNTQQSNPAKKQDFDSLMSSFLKDSDDRLSSLKRNTEGKRGGRGGRRS